VLHSWECGINLVKLEFFMTTRTRIVAELTIIAVALLVFPAVAKEIPAQLPDPDSTPADTTKPVLIIKASQGNRSLAWDILPPGSERYTIDGTTYAGYKDGDPSWTQDDPYKDIKVWYAGLQYDDFVKGIHGVLDNFATHFPKYKDQGYEIAGFAWWQGHKDGNQAHASRYELNLVNLIKAYRSEFKAPEAPFVIATIGFGGWDMAGPHLTVANAQLAVSGEKGKYPEFAGNVLTVETRDFWIDAERSPRNQDFHYNGNAETYINVGDALGRGMVKLLTNQQK
jgi:hypothetical protein